MELSFGKLLIFVPDLATADEFYEGVLGLARADGGDDFRVLRGSDFEVFLFKCADPTTSAGYGEGAGSSMCFAVTNILESMEHLRDHKVQLLHDEPQPGPGLKYVAFADPFGTVHEIIEYSS